MPAVEMMSKKQYRKAFKVLIEVGGTFQGVGQEKRLLVVTNAQYKALVAAGVVKPNGIKAPGRGKKKKAPSNETI
jgi:hypothetical protein